MSSDLAKLEVSRYFSSGADWAIAGLGKLEAAEATPVAAAAAVPARIFRRFDISASPVDARVTTLP